MICWYCHWGWSRPVMEIYRRYVAIAGESAMHYGTAHIVWDDENFSREHVQACLDDFDKRKYKDATDDQNEAVRQSLIELLALPAALRDPEPEEYDGEHPELFPPVVEMARPFVSRYTR